MRKLVLLGLLLLAACAHKSTPEEIAARQQAIADQQAMVQDKENRRQAFAAVCHEAYNNAAINPVREKLPAYWDKPTFAMKSNPDKPSKKERIAIQAYEEGGQKCLKALLTLNPLDLNQQEVASIQMQANDADQFLSKLDAAEISYSGYFEQLALYDAAVNAENERRSELVAEQQRQTQLAIMQMQQQAASSAQIAGAIRSTQPPVGYRPYP